MPVKVRCSDCQTVVNAPDRARGKAVKCPKCQSAVRVPSGKKRSAKKSGGGENVFADLDLSKAEDTQARVCPKCGADLDEEDTECPACGVDLQTGELGATARKSRSKGPNPDLFYKNAWKDGWQFVKQHNRYAIRSTIYITIFTLVFCGSLFMVGWCRNIPPRTFWGLVAFLAAMVPPGWLWHLHVQSIQSTMEKKDKLHRINFDMFLSVALGIKFSAWHIAFFVQLIVGVVGIAVIYFMENIIAGAVLIGIGYVLMLLLFPLVMAHMSQPVTYRAWAAPVMLGVLSKNFKPAAFWALLFVVTMLPIGAATGVAGAVSGRDMAAFAGTAVYNADIRYRKGQETLEDVQPGFSAKESEVPDTKPMKWKSLIVPGITLFFNIVVLSYVSLFNMRTNGQLTLYFKRRLDLITRVKEVKYVTQEERQKEQEERERAKREKKKAKQEKKKAK